VARGANTRHARWFSPSRACTWPLECESCWFQIGSAAARRSSRLRESDRQSVVYAVVAWTLLMPRCGRGPHHRQERCLGDRHAGRTNHPLPHPAPPARPSHRGHSPRRSRLAMNDLPQHLCRSITWDQGKEISLDREFTEGFGNTGLFLPPSLPWERGSNQRPPISRHCCDDQSNPPWQEPGPGGPITMAGDSGWVEDKVRLGLVVGAAVSSTP